MIIARGLDSEDTEASAKYIGSALSCPSLRLEETDKAVRRLPTNEPPKMLAGLSFVVVAMMEGVDRGRKGKVRYGLYISSHY
jgi:hypothetical protein